MSEPTADETYQHFKEQWENREPLAHLDNDEVRNKMMTLISAGMSVLILAPASFDKFMDGCAKVAKSTVPAEVQRRIKESVKAA